MAALPSSGDTVHAGELEIRLSEGLVLASGRALRLSVREFQLLGAMARRLGKIVTRDELHTTVWGGPLRRGDRSVDVYVSKLRAKLEAALPGRRFIHTHQGFGYRLQAEPSRSAAAGGGNGEAAELGDGLTAARLYRTFTSPLARAESVRDGTDRTPSG